MILENIDKKTLRKKYIDYIIESGKSPNTANTTAAQIFALWNNQGEDFFWETIHADGTALRDAVRDFVQTFYPKQTPYLSGYLTSIRYFKRFLASDANRELPVNAESIKQMRPFQQSPKAIARKCSYPVLVLTNEMLEEEHQKVLADPGYGTDYALVDSVFKGSKIFCHGLQIAVYIKTV